MNYQPRPRQHLSQLPRFMKVMLTLYVASVLVALAVSMLKYADRASWSADGVATLVVGSGEASGDPFGDPLAGTDDGLVRQEGMGRRELLDLAHPHLFTVPIVLFILGHLLHLTRLPERWKLGLAGAAFGSFFATFLLPFAVRGHPGLAPALFVAGSLLLVSFGLLCLVLLVELWRGAPAPVPAAEGPPGCAISVPMRGAGAGWVRPRRKGPPDPLPALTASPRETSKPC